MELCHDQSHLLPSLRDESCSPKACKDQRRISLQSSVTTVITDVFQKNEINLLSKFSKFMRIFDKIDDLKNQRVTYS
jgi:hypothetical protein